MMLSMRWTGVWTVVAVGLLAVGCGEGTSDTPKGVAGAAPTEAAPVEVRLGHFANVTHAQAVLGVASGDFAKAVAPAKLTVKTFNAGPSLIEALFAGEIDLGYIGPSPVINGYARSKGVGLRVISGAAANGVLIVAGKDSGITSLEQLRGKRIATPQLGNTQDVSARHYVQTVLKQDGLETIMPIPNAEQAAMMDRGEIDAAWVPEPWGSVLEKTVGATVIGRESDLWPESRFVLTVVITTPEFLAQHRPTVEKFLAAHAEWTRKLRTDPAVHAAAISDGLFEITRKRIATDVIASSLQYVEFTTEPIESSIAVFDAWAYDLGFTKAKTDLAGLVDLSALPPAERAKP